LGVRLAGLQNVDFGKTIRKTRCRCKRRREEVYNADLRKGGGGVGGWGGVFGGVVGGGGWGGGGVRGGGGEAKKANQTDGM